MGKPLLSPPPTSLNTIQGEPRPCCSAHHPWLLSSYLLGTAQVDGWHEGPLL